MTEQKKSTLAQHRLYHKFVRKNGSDYYSGQHVIRNYTTLDGGVSLGEDHPREAIVVDFAKDKFLNDLYDSAKSLASINGQFKKDKALEAVYTTVGHSLYYDEAKTQDLVKRLGVGNDGKILLGRFIQEKVGICIHQALACGAILERMIKEGMLSGKVSIEKKATSTGGHVWCRYTNSDEEVFVLDVAQNYFGLLKEMPSKLRGYVD